MVVTDGWTDMFLAKNIWYVVYMMILGGGNGRTEVRTGCLQKQTCHVVYMMILGGGNGRAYGRTGCWPKQVVRSVCDHQ